MGKNKSNEKNFFEAIENSNVRVTFGIQDWQIKRIEEERLRWNAIDIGTDEKVDMIYSIHFWDKLGKEFSWQPFTLALYYFEYLNTLTPAAST